MELFWVQIGFHQLLSAPQQTADEGDIPHSSCFPSRKCYKTTPNDVRRFFFKLLSLVLSNVWTIYGRQLSTKASVAHSVSATSTPEHWTTLSCLMCFCVSWLFIHLFCLYLTSDPAKRLMQKKIGGKINRNKQTQLMQFISPISMYASRSCREIQQLTYCVLCSCLSNDGLGWPTD